MKPTPVIANINIIIQRAAKAMAGAKREPGPIQSMYETLVELEEWLDCCITTAKTPEEQAIFSRKLARVCDTLIKVRTALLPPQPPTA